MNSNKKTHRLLGGIFLFQALTSLVSGAILLQPLMVPGNILETMTNISNNAWQLRTGIVVDLFTAVGIIILGVLLFEYLKNQNRRIALVALGLYLLEATILAVSRIKGFTLLRISQESVMTGHPTILQTFGILALESMNFGYTVHMLPFCLGAILFYFLLYKSGIIPRILSLWGLITVFIALIATMFVIFGFEIPFFVYFPYAPFEFVVGIWILIKGKRNNEGV